MKKIVFFNKTIISGGIEKCIENLTKELSYKYQFEICYYDDSILDNNVVNLISKYAKVTKLEEDTVVEADVCIWCYLYFDYVFYKKRAPYFHGTLNFTYISIYY